MDKLLHFVAGLTISLTVGFGTGHAEYGLYAGIGAGVAKEVYDRQDYGRFDGLDALATGAGAIVGHMIVDQLGGEDD